MKHSRFPQIVMIMSNMIDCGVAELDGLSYYIISV